MPLPCILAPLPLQEALATHCPLTATAAQTHAFDKFPHGTARAAQVCSASLSDIVLEYLIGKQDMATIYMSLDPYFKAFKEVIDLRKFNLHKHRITGLCLAHSNKCLFLGGMTPGTPGAKIPCWRSRLKGAWLIKVGNIIISSIADAQNTFTTAIALGSPFVKLLFSYPKICRDISHDGLPIVSSAPFSQQVHDQMNKHWDFTTMANYLQNAPPYLIVEDGDIFNYVTRVLKLTQG
jgi:hypothetical protein